MGLEGIDAIALAVHGRQASEAWPYRTSRNLPVSTS